MTNREIVRRALAENKGYMSCNDIADATGLTLVQARNALDGLLMDGSAEWKKLTLSAAPGKPANVYRLVSLDITTPNAPIGANEVARLRPLAGNPFAGLMA